MSDDPKAAATRGVEERTKETAEANAEAEKRMAASTPTPTQRENDLAKVGALDLDSLADDGSGPDMRFAMSRRMMAPQATAEGQYRTRSTTATSAPARSNPGSTVAGGGSAA